MKLIGYQKSFIPFFLANLVYIITYLAVKGFRSEKGVRLAVDFCKLRASFAAISAASFPQIPTCPGIHIKTISFWSTSVLCNISWFYVNRRWSVFDFSNARKADSERVKTMSSFS